MRSYHAIGPLIRRLPPEAAHRLAVRALAANLLPAASIERDEALITSVCGLRFENPLGMAAGFDKQGEAIGPLLRMGFGFVEIGTVTPKPQPGNAKPRVFRLPRERAVINRLGFNSEGMDLAAERLSAFRQAGAPAGVVGVNIGKNRDSDDAVADYAAVAERLGALADYVAVNLSSPNTPGLRDLQARDALAAVVSEVKGALERAAGSRGEPPPPLFVKIAPDLDHEALAASVGAAREAGANGLIATNTTTSRPASLRSRRRAEAGGLSGPPLFSLSTQILADAYRLCEGAMPIIGVGGVASGADAYAKIRAGASLVQLYTALIYEGPYLVAQILAELGARLRADGFAHIDDAVGADHR
jgi:dihydroorotate dehydrogenase